MRISEQFNIKKSIAYLKLLIFAIDLKNCDSAFIFFFQKQNEMVVVSIDKLIIHVYESSNHH